MAKTKKPTKAPKRKTATPKTGALADVFEIPTPDNRPLKCYAFDPSHGKFFGNEMTLRVKYEKLLPGPIGERIAVIGVGRDRKLRVPFSIESICQTLDNIQAVSVSVHQGERGTA